MLRPIPQLAELQLPDFVAACLSRPCNVAIGLGLNRRFVNRSRLAHELHHLVSRPSLGVNSRIYHQPHRAEKLRGKPTIVGNRILVEADLLTELLGIESPAFGKGPEAQPLQAELRQSRQLPLNRN